MKNKYLQTIQKLFWEAEELVQKRLNTHLVQPSFILFPDTGQRRNGFYRVGEGVIGLKESLFTHYEPGALKYVLWHEIAHQIVDQIFNVRDQVTPHGETFKRACDVLGIDSSATHTVDELNSYFKSGKESSIIGKIKKLMDVSGRSEEESQVFLNKANELLIRHNLSMKDISGSDNLYLDRPVGKSYKRFPSYLYTLGKILRDFYNVEYIRSYSQVYTGKLKSSFKTETTYHLELFGTPENLDLAEYIHDCVLANAEKFYQEFKNNPRRRKHEFAKISRAAFFTGVFQGFYNKLYESQKQVVKDIEVKENMLVSLDDPILKDNYRKHYPDRVSAQTSAIRGAGYGSGFSKGSQMNISTPVKSSGTKTYALC